MYSSSSPFHISLASSTSQARKLSVNLNLLPLNWLFSHLEIAQSELQLLKLSSADLLSANTLLRPME